MTHQTSGLRLWLFCLGIILLVSRPVVALDVSNNVAFNAVHLSPWDSGPAIDLSYDQTLSKSFNLDLPTLNPSPVKALADCLGVPLPFDASVTISAHIDGNVALDFGYAVTAGSFNLRYPAIGTLSIPTAAGTNQITGPAFTMTTSFQPGLQQTFQPSAFSLVSVAGGGYKPLPEGGPVFTNTTFKDPYFTTSFPSFAAWADASYDVHAGASINADLTVLGECIICASKSVTLGDSEDFPIVEINGAGVKVIRQTVAQVSGSIPIVPGEVSATISVPNLKVGSAPLPAGSTTLTGTGSQSVIQLDLSLEKLVPVIGAFLSNDIGPFGYNLLSADGGPNLGIYQNFSFTPDPKVQLNFSQTMLVEGSDAVYRPTNSVLFNLGDPLNIKVPFGTQNLVSVQPTYILDNLFSNETGITLGASVTVSGLSLTSSFGDLGPAFSDTLSSDGLVHIPLYDNSFEEALGSITPDPFTIDVGTHLGSAFIQRYDYAGVVSNSDGTFDIGFRDTQTGEIFYLSTSGQTVTAPLFCPPNLDICPDPLTILDTGQDLVLQTDQGSFDVGNLFCIFCIEATGPLGTTSPSVTDDLGNVLFLTDLSNFPSGDCESNIGICDGTLAAANRAFNPIDPSATQIVSVSATTVVTSVPEPATIALLAGGSVSIAYQRRRRLKS